MEHLKNNWPKIKEFLERRGPLLLSAVYLVLAYSLMPRFGLPLDSPKNFSEGRINLNFLLTGLPLSTTDHAYLAYQIHGSFFFMLFEFVARILLQGFDWADRITARQVLLPVLVCFFMNVFYLFMKKRTGARTALIACAVLITYPHFFGHMFNNIKDIPLFIFFTLTILCFFDWAASGFAKTRFLYGSFACFALALNSKLYACLAPGILVLWLAVMRVMKISTSQSAGTEPKTGRPGPERRMALHLAIGALIVTAFTLTFFMPAFYAGDKEKLIVFKRFVAKDLFGPSAMIWSLYPFVQILFVTPLLTLVTALTGLLRTAAGKIKDPLDILMTLWLGAVLLASCTPVIPAYNGVRLFLNFLVPFSFFAAKGIETLADLAERHFRWKSRRLVLGLGLAVIGGQIAGIVSSHPYEVLYFNSLAGGLKGAQQKKIPEAEDYWFLAFREAVDWMNRNAPGNAHLFSTNFDGKYCLLLYPLRSDISCDTIRSVPIPRNSFLLVSQSGSAWMNLYHIPRQTIENEAGRMIKVREIRSQGGLLLTIYYKP